jgi:SAM-dependent MidA family methyltransferase
LRWTPAFAAVTGPGEASILEASPAATAIISNLAERLARDGGALLAIDYGHEGPAFGDTLQAMRGHAFAEPLAEPGAADLTAHVDFAALAEAARRAGAQPRPLLGQGVPRRLGIAARAERASPPPARNAAAVATIGAAVHG